MSNDGLLTLIFLPAKEIQSNIYVLILALKQEMCRQN